MDELREAELFSKTLQATAAATARAGDAEVPGMEPDRQAKIELLRRQIAEGSYRPDAAKLAKRLITDHLNGEQLNG